jgi:FkbM family methyltransferase
MKLSLEEHDNIKFYCREKTSDFKTFEEVIVNNVYEKKFFKIKPKEHWIDLGGNVGAFSLVALSKGATVEIYEPDPFNCKMIERNLKLNNYNAKIINKAVVSSEKKQMTMYVANNLQVWRNSLYKNWGNQKFKVDCINYKEVIVKDSNVKMDIEGAEMNIIEDMKLFPKKLIVEWSLDIDPNLNRYRNAIDKLKGNYKNINYKKQFYNLPDDKIPNNIFPKCDNIYCL